MKANRVPEKLYCCDKGNGNLFVDYRPFPNDKSIEYTRNEAFIKKACDWLRKCLDNGLWVANDVGETEKEAIIEHFKETMRQ